MYRCVRSYRHKSAAIVGVVRELAVAGTSELHCPAQLTVRVHKAVLRDSVSANGLSTGDGEDDGSSEGTGSSDCSEFFHNKCMNMPSCSISVSECQAASGSKSGAHKVALSYSCEPATTDGSHDFICCRVPGGSSEGGSSHANIGSGQFQRVLRRCLESEHCKYVTCEDAALHDDEYTGGRPAGRCALLKPESFSLPGFAVYPNYAGLCSRPSYVKTRDFYEVAKTARSHIHSSFTIAYKPTSQFGIDSRYSGWVCRGIPTIVPMAGHVVAVPAARGRGHPRSPAEPGRSMVV
ncbi:Protocadherin Fat, putative [Babesia ovata]|uniref:Protocadherin Fat, putative n=1 Tax=Babesia ovata TaxID=189622 RepID=A0A2H6KFN4_9APIC|nr:Protocadherin Fat, putative [Babesia ovata]GBE61797.1 Protocadherin Fat, putative [Babesia ovata]